MKIGFIGAGKVGCSLGKYFVEGGYRVTGYADCHEKAAVDAADFTGTKYYAVTSRLVEDSDIIFLTVSDSFIEDVWNEVKSMPLAGKLICHTSGSIPSTIFSGISEKNAFGYSVHPLYAVHSKWTSYQELSKAVFTIEGAQQHIEEIRHLFTSLGNRVETVSAENKAKYHAAAVFASNYVTALANVCAGLLTECGFSEETAKTAYLPLMLGNVENISSSGIEGALTGPIERNDILTLQKHKACLSGKQYALYQALAEELLHVAKRKHPETDYREMEEFLNQ